MIRDLIRRGNFKVILKHEVPERINVLIGRFTLAIKSAVDRETKFRPRHVAGGYHGVLKDYLLYGAKYYKLHRYV